MGANTKNINKIKDYQQHDISKQVFLGEVLAVYGIKSQQRTPKILDDDKNFFHLVAASREGLPYQSFHNAQITMPFTLDEWSQMLHISKRSIDRLKKEKRRLNPTQTEKLIEITMLFDYGVDVFGSFDKFSTWLTRSNTGLGGVTPKSLLDTNLGIKAIHTTLSRIEYGVLA